MPKPNTPAEHKHKPVTVDNATYARIHTYSEITNIPIKHVLAEAVNDWMDTVGAARLELMLNSKTPLIEKAKVLAMPLNVASAAHA